MEGEAVNADKMAEILPDIIAGALAGVADLRVEVRFCVAPPGTFKESDCKNCPCETVAEIRSDEDSGHEALNGHGY